MISYHRDDIQKEFGTHLKDVDSCDTSDPDEELLVESVANVSGDSVSIKVVPEVSNQVTASNSTEESSHL